VTYNITSTIVAYKFVPIMIENGWTFVAFNENPTAFRSIGDGSAIMVKNGMHVTRKSDGLEEGIRSKRGETNGDEVPPTFVGATIPSSGATVRVLFNEPLAIGSFGAEGMRLVMSGGNVRAFFQSISDTNPNLVTYTLERIVRTGETGTITYKQPAGGLQDISGNDVESFTGNPVTNGSNQP
jgi:hypothetical protein